MTGKSKTRDPLFDLAKAFAMFMVVFGHVAGAAHMFAGRVYSFGIGFKMPLFFIISGYFLWSTIDRGDWHKLLSHLRTYFVPLAWISIGFAIISAILGTIDRSFIGIAKWAFGFACGQWFVWALAGAYTLTFIVCYFIRVPSARIVGLLIAALLALCLPFPYAREMYPYFLFGCVIRAFKLQWWQNAWGGAICLLVYMAVVFIEGDVAYNGMAFYYTDTSIAAFLKCSGTLLWIARHALGIIGSFAVLSTLYYLYKYIPAVSRLAVFGGTTLGVYLLHQQMIKMVERIPHVFESKIGVFISVIVLFLVCHCLVVISRDKIAALRILLWGYRK